MADKEYPPEFKWQDIEPGSGFVKLKFGFDKPLTGEGEWGKWFRYAFKKDGEDRSWFLHENKPEELEIHNLLTSLGIKRGTEVLIKTVFYQWTDKKGNKQNDVYGIVDFKGKEYEFGKKGEKKESKPDQPDVERQPTKKEPLPKTDQMVVLRDLYEECLHEVLDMLKTTYDDPDKPKPNEQFSGSEVVRMINTLFMAKAKVI